MTTERLKDVTIQSLGRALCLRAAGASLVTEGSQARWQGTQERESRTGDWLRGMTGKGNVRKVWLRHEVATLYC